MTEEPTNKDPEKLSENESMKKCCDNLSKEEKLQIAREYSEIFRSEQYYANDRSNKISDAVRTCRPSATMGHIRG